MDISNRSLLSRLEQAVLDEGPVAPALRICLILAGQAGSGELRTWAERELRGYGPDDDLPDYRKLSAPLQVNAFVGPRQLTGQTVSPRQLPEWAQEYVDNEVAFRHGISEIEAMSRRDSSLHFSPPGSVEIARAMDEASGEPFQQITGIYWTVTPEALSGLVDQIRTRLAGLVAELRADVGDAETTPSRTQADHAFNVVVNGAESTVNVNSAQSTSRGDAHIDQRNAADSEQDPAWWRRWRRPAALIVGLAGLVGAYAGLGQWLDWAWPPW